MPVYPFMIFFFSIGGVIILGGASSLYQSTEARRKNAVVPTEAQIVERVIDMSKSTSFVYEFFIDGVRYHAEFFGKFLWRDGKMVSIRYDPDCPEIIYIPSVFRCIKNNRFVYSWRALAACGCDGAGLLVAGRSLIVLSNRLISYF